MTGKRKGEIPIYSKYNEDNYLLYNGRRATGSSLLGMTITLIFCLINSVGWIPTIAFMLLAGYLFLTGFWGAHKTNRWFIKYKSRLPLIIWHLARIPVIVGGMVLGFLLWGLLEHLFLLLAMEDTIDNSHFKSFFIVFILLLPYLGPYYGDWINYNPSQKTSAKF